MSAASTPKGIYLLTLKYREEFRIDCSIPCVYGYNESRESLHEVKP